MNNLNEIKVVDFKDEYAEDLSNIIKRNLLEVNIKDYSKEEMEDAARIFTPEFLIKEAKHRKIYNFKYRFIKNLGGLKNV